MDRHLHGWYEEIDIANKYRSYQTRFLDMLSKSQHMLDDRLGHAISAKHGTKLLESMKQLVHSVPYRVGPKSCKFDEIDNILKGHIAKPALTKRTSPTVFNPKKDGTLRFCVDYQNLNAVTKRDSYQILQMDE